MTSLIIRDSKYRRWSCGNYFTKINAKNGANPMKALGAASFTIGAEIRRACGMRNSSSSNTFRDVRFLN